MNMSAPQSDSINTSTSGSVPANVGTPEKPKLKAKRKDRNVIYMTVEESNDPIHVKIRRIILKVIDDYVTANKKPIRRKDLIAYVFASDNKLREFYEKNEANALAVFSFALSRLVKEKKVVRVKDPERRRPTYYILPKHLVTLRNST